VQWQLAGAASHDARSGTRLTPRAHAIDAASCRGNQGLPRGLVRGFDASGLGIRDDRGVAPFEVPVFYDSMIASWWWGDTTEAIVGSARARRCASSA
jgi:hypothetical protein